MKILLIENDPGISSFIKIGLELHHYKVDTAFDAPEGEKLSFSGKYDIIVLDTEVSGSLDLELSRKISKSKKLTPVIMLTSLDSIVNLITGLDSRGNDYLMKPFSFDELLARLKLLTRT